MSKLNNQLIGDLKQLMEIKSVLDTQTAAQNAPFGQGNRQVLDWFLQKAAEYGLKTGEIDGYAGYAEYGEGEHCIAALCHLDVVPGGEGWTVGDPYTLTTKNDHLYGRGIVDNKGPAIMCLHALKQIAQSQLKTKHRIRIIAGTNEEHGSACIKYYVKNAPKADIPILAIVPDAEFPIINSEKGILHTKINIPLDNFFLKNIAFIKGGDSLNVIPDKASVSIFKNSEAADLLNQISPQKIDDKIFSSPIFAGNILASGAKITDFSIKEEADAYTITAKGVAGHAMAPQNGDNAIWKIITFLHSLSQSTIDSTVLKFLKDYLCTHQSTNALQIFYDDKKSGQTTINMGILEFDDQEQGFLKLTLDMRLPIIASKDEVLKNITAKLPKKSTLTELRWAANLYIDEDDEFIKTLLQIYQEKTGKEGYCIQIGGGTYARELPKAVAFGPMPKGKDGNLHKPDEVMSSDDFVTAMEIYKQALIKLSI
ncbi:MAG: Sapep family Mn(2+)-dependent dipeptidase [Firmicutes bacterium]|nr:Sapep family Mn(2+)-dependent dipeptidase [Bacillota bacterium]